MDQVTEGFTEEKQQNLPNFQQFLPKTKPGFIAYLEIQIISNENKWFLTYISNRRDFSQGILVSLPHPSVPLLHCSWNSWRHIQLFSKAQNTAYIQPM